MSGTAGERVTVTTRDGVELTAAWHAPSKTIHGAVLLLPAVAAPARSLRQLASQLADAGIGVLRADYRYTAESLPRPDKTHDASMADLLQQDVPALLAMLAQRAPGVGYACAGHSLGGQLSALALASYPASVKAAVLITTSFPHEALWSGSRKLAVATAFRLYPWLAQRFGRLPARPLGLGVETTATLMKEWGHWGVTGQYTARDIHLGAVLAQTRGPLLSVGATDDVMYAPDRALQAFVDMAPMAAVTRWMLTPQETGARTLGHFGLLQSPAVNVLAHRVAGWLLEAWGR